ncbi:MAG: hypothetical protein B6U89_06285 [Desulfurococcales archaeon ex4484_58]|nr:MAG: hypothetical protein B6U89_06285 [Desulfurococcales archaeon ex4484_58]
MTSCNEILPKLADWLKQGSTDARNLVDFPWEVSIIDNNTLKAIYPRFPAEILVSCDDKLGIIRLSTSLNIETISLNTNDRLIVYRKLLRRNNVPLVKYSLIGDEDLLTLNVDLSIKSLGKEEFNDALAMLLSGIVDAVKMLGIEEYYQQILMLELVDLVKKHVDEGWGREKLYNYLVRTVGLSEEEAREILNSMFSREGGAGVYI